ncbi:MAG TPA: RIP metalloprotease RseP [Candidatus Paceibacterota bacterium]|nr:RIP metalloprotease RseP [Candidatus Paceibacterota bacterium]
MATLKFILVLLEVLMIFNLLIAVHELGHFLAAKWRGLKIDRFAIWFGKPIWKKKIGGVEYALGWIPAGGYVALPQMASMEAIEGKSDRSEGPLPNISALDKIIVAFAGPLFSFLLAVAFAVVVWGVGKPEVAGGKTTTLGWVDPNGPAWNAGLRAGDTILEVNSNKVTEFAPPSQDSITWRIITSAGTNIPIKYVRNGEERMAYPVPYRRATHWYERKALRQILVAPAIEPVVDQPLTNSPAQFAGLKHGDKIIKLEGEKISSAHAVWYLEDTMTNGATRPVTFTIQRGDEQIEKTLTPERPLKPNENTVSFGIQFLGNTNVAIVHPTPGKQIEDSANQIFNTLGALFSRHNDIGPGQLGGAVMIMRVYSNLFDNEQGWRLVLWFSVVLNVNLALLNMLPFPVLDGGHITLAIIEVIRRRPVSSKLLEYIQTGCAILLIGFMLFIAFFDTGDWVRSAKSNKPIVFAPKN